MSYILMYKCRMGDEKDSFIYLTTDYDGNVIPERFDNGLNHRVTIDKMTAQYRIKGSKEYKTEYQYLDDKIDFYITESRLIFKVQSLKRKVKFQGSFVDMGVSAVFAKQRNKKVDGYFVGGQIRYEWLKSIMYMEKDGFGDSDKLRFSYVDNDEISWLITVSFPGPMDVKFIANEILHMSCRYRLKMTDEKKEEEVKYLEKYLTEEITPSQDPKNEFSLFSYKGYYLAPAGSAYRPKM